MKTDEKPADLLRRVAAVAEISNRTTKARKVVGEDVVEAIRAGADALDALEAIHELSRPPKGTI